MVRANRAIVAEVGRRDKTVTQPTESEQEGILSVMGMLRQSVFFSRRW